MNRAYTPLLVVVAVVVVAILSGVFYKVNEREQVIITQFGRPVRGPLTEPGLKMKVPFVQTVRRFEKRILEWDGTSEQIPTLDKRFILLDTTARWRIVDPLRFLQAAGNERSAQSRLDDIVESSARDVVSSHDLIQVVRNFQRVLEPVETELMSVEWLKPFPRCFSGLWLPAAELGQDAPATFFIHPDSAMMRMDSDSVNHGKELNFDDD
jgi:membrane protease subunit HflC